ncbi:unnamed protein product [Ilex paraguariensis]|uniref:F-box domain-containing protein n=1 Tax=Ilex paraguariensis TaxID=185542 RepID=A0ABC8RD01_9AQUA
MKRKPSHSRTRRRPKQTPNWLQLPSDVTASILHRVGAIDILENVQKVCTTWRRICKDPAMWRVIDMCNLGDLHSIPYDLEKMCRHAVDRSQGQLIDINIEYFGTDELLEYIADRSRAGTKGSGKRIESSHVEGRAQKAKFWESIKSRLKPLDCKACPAAVYGLGYYKDKQLATSLFHEN